MCADRSTMQAALLRRWYERHRESRWARLVGRPARQPDEFMLALLRVAGNLNAMPDDVLRASLRAGEPRRSRSAFARLACFRRPQAAR